jgi:predicted O-methyltransferase YrrM
VFTAFIHHQKFKRGAEIGVDRGLLFKALLIGCPDLELLIGVDTFPDEQRSREAFEYEHHYNHKAKLIPFSSHAASSTLDDGSLDFVFIDADHSYEAVKQDITDWRPKVRSGGWLGGHDYSVKFPGVIRAVHEAFGENFHRMGDDIWGVWVK